MDGLESFIQKFGGVTESYWFYDHTIELRYDVKNHIYLLVTPDGTLEKVNGVTSTCHIIDKSMVLIPWACKMMQQKLVTQLPFYIDTEKPNYIIPVETLNKLIADSKSAHRERLEEAGDIGSIAHAWIEEYIKSKINNDVLKYNELIGNFPVNESAKNACIAALEWMHRHNVIWIGTERKIYSRKHKYAGTMDGLCWTSSCDNPLCCPKPFTNRLTIADWKTSNYLYPEYIMQTASYEAAYEEETGEVVQDRWIIRLGKEDAKFEPWHLEEDSFQDDFDAFLAALDLKSKFDALENRVDILKDIYRQQKKKNKEDWTAEANLKKCKNADKYQGKRKPICNNGHPCEYCLTKYTEVQAGKPAKVKKTKKVKPTSHEVIKSLESLIKPLDKQE